MKYDFSKIESLFDEGDATKLKETYAIKLNLRSSTYSSWSKVEEDEKLVVKEDLASAVIWFNCVNNTRQIEDYKISGEDASLIVILKCDEKYDNSVLAKKISPLSKYLYNDKKWAMIVNSSGRLFKTDIRHIATK